ncbi:hypothetical protein Hsar01_00611 [Haloferula sargassicola]|uniref:Methyltransferase type 11 domain-containing protein n=2 Tax=Haloferula sargassicola TaxID=490096 RepID=A0ABP9UL49_9BACT
MKVLRGESRHLYHIFAAGIRDDLKKKWESTGEKEFFRTLRYLASGSQLVAHDQSLLAEIINVGKKQLKLIESSSSAQTNPAFSELMGKLGAHVRTLILASEHKLDGIPDLAEKLVFPLEVDGALETEIRRLQDDFRRIDPNEKRVRRKQSCADAPTVDFYTRNSSDYFRQTAFLNLEEIYEKFRGAGLPRGALILDAGCGVGRDTRYFIQHGYRVVSFDASKGMVDLCNEYPFAYCVENEFRDLSFCEEFDAVWACASLLHVGRDLIQVSIERLVRALKPGGVFYASFKEAPGSSRKDSRCFHYYDQVFLDGLLAGKLGLEELEVWSNAPRKENDKSEFINYLYRKPKVVPLVKGLNT